MEAAGGVGWLHVSHAGGPTRRESEREKIKLLPPVNWRWVKEGDGYVSNVRHDAWPHTPTERVRERERVKVCEGYAGRWSCVADQRHDVPNHAQQPSARCLVRPAAAEDPSALVVLPLTACIGRVLHIASHCCTYCTLEVK